MSSEDDKIKARMDEIRNQPQNYPEAPRMMAPSSQKNNFDTYTSPQISSNEQKPSIEQKPSPKKKKKN